MDRLDRAVPCDLCIVFNPSYFCGLICAEAPWISSSDRSCSQQTLFEGRPDLEEGRGHARPPQSTVAIPLPGSQFGRAHKALNLKTLNNRKAASRMRT